MRNMALRAALSNIWMEYSTNSCIHGFRFLASRKLTLLEKVIWLGAIVISGVTIVLQVWLNWSYYKSYPMQIVETASQLPLEEFSFPAVTICSVFKIKYSRAEAHVKRVLGPNATAAETSSYWDTLIANSLLHFPHYSFPSQFIDALNVTGYPIKNEDIPVILKEVSHKVEDIMSSCSWRGSEYNCSDMFRTQATEEGFCLAFNSWTAEETYSDSAFYNLSEPYGEPLQNTAAGKHTGLELYLKDPDKEFFHAFQKQSVGYNIMVHSPWNMPDISWNIQIDRLPSKVQRIYVKPIKLISDISVKNTPRVVRGCNWDQDPRQLAPGSSRNFERSDRNMCFIQCRLNATAEICKCVPWYHKPLPGYIGEGTKYHTCRVLLSCGDVCPSSCQNEYAPDETYHKTSNEEILQSIRTNKYLLALRQPGIKFCDIPDMRCLDDLEDKIRNHETNDQDRIIVNSGDTLICNCMRSCSYVLYETELVHSTINMPFPSELYAIVDISYKERHGRGYRREVKYTFKDFAVTVGGFASLFLGCSVISILEIVYYLGLAGAKVYRRKSTRRAPSKVSPRPYYPFLP